MIKLGIIKIFVLKAILKLICKNLDTNNDGTITVKEAHDALTTAIKPITTKIVKKLNSKV